MRFRAEINVMPLPALLDPQGNAVSNNMKNVGLPGIGSVRIGKHIHLEIEATDRETAQTRVDEACRKLLCNKIMEHYEFDLFELSAED